MIDSLWFWGFAALMLFWSMGAYNRLIRLRSRAIVAFAALEGLFNQYVAMVKVSFPESGFGTFNGMGAGDDSDMSAWGGLVASTEQFSASLRVAHPRPLDGPAMGALKTAYETLNSSWIRLRDLPPDLAGAAFPAPLQAQWEHVSIQVELMRAEFNKTVLNYNEAIGQFPALLLAWIVGFKAAQPL